MDGKYGKQYLFDLYSTFVQIDKV